MKRAIVLAGNVPPKVVEQIAERIRNTQIYINPGYENELMGDCIFCGEKGVSISEHECLAEKQKEKFMHLIAN